MPDQEFVCNVCGGTEFVDFRDRKKVRCAKCRTLERGRLMYMALQDLGLIKPRAMVLHIAPEAGIARGIKEVVKSGYHGVDIHYKRFPVDLGVTKFNLITDTASLPSKKYDLIIHSHVIEHLPCNMTMVLLHLHRALKRNGKHVFCLPFSRGKYKANFNKLSNEQRTSEFGQFDHVRRFGKEDIDRHIGMIFKLTPHDHLKYNSPDEILRVNSPIPQPGTINGNTIFVQDKDSLRVGV